MSDPIIPPSPSKKDYTQDPSYTRQAERNAVEIFDSRDPFALFTDWMAEAREAELNDSNAMSLATVDAHGLPDVRMVLLKGVDARGFAFYSNQDSAKGQQLLANQAAALCFHWKSLRRQVRVRGAVELVDETEVDAYFASRARGSQLGAWCSDQSRAVESRAALEARVAEAEARFEGKPVPRPPYWRGWRVVPTQIEFWRDRPYRLHDRLEFTRENISNDWTTQRLYP